MVSEMWHSHQSIEAYCAEKTEALLKTLDELFCDIRNVVETIVPPDESIIHSPIDALRISTGQSSLQTRIHRMQLEVLTRASERKRQDICALDGEKEDAITSTNDLLSLRLKPLPTLPNEILSQIFTRLYWSDVKHPAGSSTLIDLAADPGTDENWRLFIRKCIPIAIASTNVFGTVHGGYDPYIRALVGSKPNLYTIPRLLDECSEDLLKSVSRSSTFIFTTLSDFGELEQILHIPWRNIVLSRRSVVSPEGTVRSFVQTFGTKLAEVDLNLLEIHAINIGTHVVDDSSPRNPEEYQFLDELEPKLRKARLDLNHEALSSYRPFLRNIVDLDISILSDLYSSSSSSTDSGKIILDLLEPFSNTLESLVLTTEECYPEPSFSASHSSLINRTSDGFINATPLILFPRLNQLKISSIMECVAEDILFTIGCPSLHHLSLTFKSCRCYRSRDSVVGLVSATTLHKLFPTLKSISPHLNSQTRNAQLFTDLSTPQDPFGWLLPRLESIDIRSEERKRYNMRRPPPLSALVKLVSSRLSNSETNVIRSIRMRDIELLPETANTFGLLVPEFIN